jgi:two-component system, OmpR family, phosphate regulon sensor histidine kinase PhoR
LNSNLENLSSRKLGKIFKNQTPLQVCIYISFFNSLTAVLLHFLLHFPEGMRLSWPSIFLYSSLIFLFTFIITYYFIQNFIYRKVKLIYKSIREFRKMPTEKNTNIRMNTDILSQVEEEVIEWSLNKTKELENMKSLAEYRRNFLGDVMHELKTPLFNLQGFLMTLNDGAIEDPELATNYINRCIKNLDRLIFIIDDLQTIGRMESEGIILDLQVFDIYNLVKEVFEELEIKALNRNISLQFKEGANLHYRIRADKESMRQVFINLIHNSIKYGRPGGNTKISFYDMDKAILIEVSDNGLGIPPEHLPRIFDRFYRVDKSRSREQGGSGLGLAIVKHIIEAHGQTINLRSTPNVGSTFSFTMNKA